MLRVQVEGKTIELDNQDVLDIAFDVISRLKANGCADWNVARVLVQDYRYTYLEAKALLSEWQRRRPKSA